MTLKLFGQFKSYYVVWKRSSKLIHQSPYMRLNRTMQYGNKNIFSPNNNIISFKSYYVVWKLITGAVEKKKKKFKSYYVVWKPWAGYIF